MDDAIQIDRGFEAHFGVGHSAASVPREEFEMVAARLNPNIPL
jgi:hypothetical protein